MKIKLVSLDTKDFVSSIAFMLYETILLFMFGVFALMLFDT